MFGGFSCADAIHHDDELCARLHQLAVISPLARNFQEHRRYLHPYDLGRLTRVSIYHNMKLRYSLLRYLYL